MKKRIFYLSLVTIFVIGTATINTLKSSEDSPSENSANICTSPSLYEITNSWVKSFNALHPNSDITVAINSADEESEKSIRILSQKDLSAEGVKSSWKMVIGREVIVPIMNAENPYIDEILKGGISPQEFATVYSAKKTQKWGSILNSKAISALNCYILNEESVLSGTAEFMNLQHASFAGKTIDGYEALLETVRNDKNAIAFCRFIDFPVSEIQDFQKAFRFIPIDVNNNGKVDHMENFYSNPNDLLRGIWIGKYPKPLYSNIYAISNVAPTQESDIAFLEWILTDGQDYLTTYGLLALSKSERQPKVQKLYSIAATEVIIDYQSAQSPNIFLLLAITALLIMATVFIVRMFGKKSPVPASADNCKAGLFEEGKVFIPSGVFFDKTHTWAFMEMDGSVKIGIADFLQHITGPITKLMMKKPGEVIEKGEPFLTLSQNGKQLVLNAPVTGTIEKRNSKLETHPSYLNTSPYSDGWIYQISTCDWPDDIKGFMMGHLYRKWVKKEFIRLKEVLSHVLQKRTTDLLPIILQDGGTLKDHVLEDLDPTIWEEFQSRFINTSK